jgi:serine/threonine protein kinase
MNDAPRKPGPAQSEKVGESTGRSLGATSGTVVGAGNASGPGAEVPRQMGDYVVIRKLGEGGMGAVYLAEDARLHRKAAIKTLKPELAADPELRERFEREARAAAAVEHDNIVPIWQIGTATNGTPFIAMPFLQGEMLDERLKREPVAGLGLIVKVAKEVADGLAAAHAHGLIHRDIKPSNIWLEGNLSSSERNDQIRRCKILDFGLARTVECDEAQLTAVGAVLGTPAYMAPEQARGEKLDPRADLFSLGVVLFRMATGEKPFRGQTAMAVLIALTTQSPPPVRTLAPTLPSALAQLIDQLLCKDPAGRPDSAADVGARVRQIVKDLQARKAAAASPNASTSQPVPVYVLPTPAPSPWEEVIEAEVTRPEVIEAEVTETEAEEPPSRKAPAKPPNRAPKRKAQAKRSKGNRATWIIAASALGLIALFAVLAVVVVRVQTAEGTLVVELNDPDVEARIKNGKLVLLGPDGKERYTLSPAERNKKIDAGSYTIRVEGADGVVLDTREFALKKNGEVRVRVTLEPKLVRKVDPPKKEPPKADDPDRRAAEYVLSIGGRVRVEPAEGIITAAKDLPAGPVKLIDIHLGSNKQVTDAGLECLKGCKYLSALGLDGTGVGDVGLVHIAGSRSLYSVHLSGTRVTDEGLAHLKDCPKLAFLDLTKTKVSAGCVAEFAKAMPQCRILFDGEPIEPVAEPNDRAAAEWALTNGGSLIQVNRGAVVKRAADLPDGPIRLTTVDMYLSKQATDAGLAHLKDCKNLTSLFLFGTPVSDAGLVHLKGCQNLASLGLGATQVTDDGLEHLKGLNKLTRLTLEHTRVTARGVADLARALPQCKIDWDGNAPPKKK